VTGRPNAELAWRVIDHIDAHPEQHDQNAWIDKSASCGTVACYAGWTCLLSNDEPFEDEDGDTDNEVWVDGHIETVQHRALHLLGLSYDRDTRFGHLLFAPENTREDLERLVAEIFGPRPEQVLFIRQDGTSVDVTPEPGEADVPPNAGSAS
jgi:hypothetical protein